MNSSKKIEINRSTLVSLKAELSRKQQEVNEAKAHGHLIRTVKEKKPTIWSKQNVGVGQRDERDFEQIEEEKKALKNSKSCLEAKAKLYDQLSSASCSREDTANAQATLLVDFKQKQQENARQQAEQSEEEEEEEGQWSDHPSDPDDEWVDYTDCLGRTRRCLRADLEILKKQDSKLSHSLGGDDNKGVEQPEPVEVVPEPVERPPSPPLEQQLVSGALHREALRAKWEQEETELRDKDSVHYQDLLYDEVRNHGVSYFGFSRDEKERRAQQDKLARARNETRVRQAEARDARSRREQQLRARLRAAANRKRERQGLPPLPESDGDTERGASDEEADVERVLLGHRARAVEPPQEPEPLVREERPAPAVPRPWDLDKEKPVMTQDEWNEKQRAERKSEFAPPSSTSYGFHSGGKFYLDTKPAGKEEEPKRKKQNSKRGNKMDALTIPRKNAPKKVKPSSSSSSDDEMIGPLPPKQTHIESIRLPDVSVPPPGFGAFSVPPPSPITSYSTVPPTPVPPPKIPVPVPPPKIPVPVPPPKIPVPVPPHASWTSSFNPVDVGTSKPRPKRQWSDAPPPQETNRGKGVEIAPPTSMEYHIGIPRKINQRPSIAKKKEVETSIAAGLSFLRKQVEEKEKQKTKSRFDT